MQPSEISHKIGVGLRSPHYTYLETRPKTEVSWFEAPTELYMSSQGHPWDVLRVVRQDYPVALHGVSMNIGCPEGVHRHYLQKLRELIDRVEPFIVSDHLSWTGSADINFHDLLPLPFTEDSIATVVNNIDFVQNFLRRPLILENVSTYISYRKNQMHEWDFITEVCRRSGCGLLLDLNNVHINSHNHGFDPQYYLNHIPFDRVAQVHMSGPTDLGIFLFDTHSSEIPEEIWNLFRKLAPQLRHLPILIERDEDIPSFHDMENEVMKAFLILENSYESDRSSEPV